MQVILQIKTQSVLGQVSVCLLFLACLIFASSKKPQNDPKSPQTGTHTSQQVKRHSNTKTPTIWEMPSYNCEAASKQI